MPAEAGDSETRTGRGSNPGVVSKAPSKERKILTEKLDKILAQAMAGDSRELTDADWKDIVAGRYKHPFDPDSLAVPPGWKPKKKQGR